MTDAEVMAEIEGNVQTNRNRAGKNTSAIVVKGVHDVAVRFPNAAALCREMRL